jgi:hypothetical protein
MNEREMMVEALGRTLERTELLEDRDRRELLKEFEKELEGIIGLDKEAYNKTVSKAQVPEELWED